MKLHQIARARVLEGAPSHPNNPNIGRSNQADTQAKAKAGSAAERDAQLDQERKAEKGPEARDTTAERDRKARKVTLQKLSAVTDWSPQNQTLGRLLTQLLDPDTVRPGGGK
jgi:hypothetical protein